MALLPPVTQESIAAAKLATYLERFDVWCKTGVEIRADGSVVVPQGPQVVPGAGQFGYGYREFAVGVRLGRVIGAVGGASLGARLERK